MNEDLAARLSRWSQRKLAVRRGVAVDDEAERPGRSDASPPQEMPQAQDAAAEARRETAPADTAQAPEQEAPALPPVEELTADSDFTQFMAKNVPEAIKRAALRKLWTSDPVLANLDRLNDYDEDYSIAETLMAAVRTSYQVGKGYIDDLEAGSAEREPANDERARRIEVSQPHASPAEPAGAGDAASPQGVRDNDAGGASTATAPQPTDKTETSQARPMPVGDKG